MWLIRQLKIAFRPCTRNDRVRLAHFANLLNMMDEARRRGIQINTQKLSQRLGVPVVETVAVRNAGIGITCS